MGKKPKHKKVKKITEVKTPGLWKDHSHYVYWGILILILLFTAFIRIRLLRIPLERDEGEFAYMGQLMLQGIPPYLISYNMKFPGIYAAYALMMFVFGQSVEGIHLGFLVINGATIILVFLLTKHLFDASTGIIASACFAILSMSPTVLGTSAHATHFVLLPALGGILLMLKAIDPDKPILLFWSGILLGLSVMMKQAGVFFIIFAFLYLMINRFRIHGALLRLFLKQGFLFSAGAIIPFMLTCGILLIAGVFEKFWFWTFSYASEYGSQVTLSEGSKIFLTQASEVMGNFYLLWGMAGIGISALFWDRTRRTHNTFLLGFSLFSFLAVCPGLYFREHYFVLILPAAACLMGIAISSLRNQILKFEPGWQFFPTLLFLIVFLLGVYSYRSFFFELSPFQACRMMYGSNPFPESIEISNYIRAHSQEQDKIAILGSEPQIYFYAKRQSASGYIYTYPLMEEQRYSVQMQKEMIEEIEKAQPGYLVFVNVSTSWLPQKKSERVIFDWAKRYIHESFQLVGIIDLLTTGQTEYRWDNEVAHYTPRSQNFVYVFKRKT